MPKSKVRKKKKQSQRRATPPSTPEAKYKESSPTWYVAVMFGLIAIGGLAAIAAGFAMTLNYH